MILSWIIYLETLAGENPYIIVNYTTQNIGYVSSYHVIVVIITKLLCPTVLVIMMLVIYNRWNSCPWAIKYNSTPIARYLQYI